MMNISVIKSEFKKRKCLFTYFKESKLQITKFDNHVVLIVVLVPFLEETCTLLIIAYNYNNFFNEDTSPFFK